jgi:hypothetical protein
MNFAGLSLIALYKPKFKIGDRIRLKNNETGYDIGRTTMKKGDTVIIDIVGRSDYSGEILYGFEEDDKEETENEAIWCNVEDNFELVIDIEERE